MYTFFSYCIYQNRWGIGWEAGFRNTRIFLYVINQVLCVCMCVCEKLLGFSVLLVQMTFHCFLNTTCKLVSSVWILSVSCRLRCHLVLGVTLALWRQHAPRILHKKQHILLQLKPEHDSTATGYFSTKETFVRKCGSVVPTFAFKYLTIEETLCCLESAVTWESARQCFPCATIQY